MEETLRKHRFKIQVGTAVAFVLTLIAWTWYGAITFEDLNHKIDVTAALAERNKLVNIELQAEAVVSMVQLAEIKTELVSINKSLIEIKVDLRNHSLN